MSDIEKKKESYAESVDDSNVIENAPMNEENELETLHRALKARQVSSWSRVPATPLSLW